MNEKRRDSVFRDIETRFITMRKKIISTTLIILLISNLFLLALHSEKNYVFTMDHFVRDDKIPYTMDVLSYKSDYATYYVEGTDTNLAEEIVTKSEEILSEIKSLSGNHTWEKPKLYFLDDLNVAITIEEYGIFIHTKDFLADSARFHQEMIYWQYPCDYWLSYGLSHRGLEVNLEELSAFYSKEENLKSLSLFGARFFEKFVDDVQVQMTEKTAVSLTNFILEEKPEVLEQLLNPGDNYLIINKIKNDWLNNISVPLQYENELESTNYKIRFFSREDELIVQLQNLKIVLEDEIYDDSEDSVANIDLFELFMEMTYQDLTDMKTFLKTELGADCPDLEKEVTCQKHLRGRSFYNGSNHIYFSNWLSLLHELVHAYFLTGSGSEDVESYWLNEGLAEYLGTIKFNSYCKESFLKSQDKWWELNQEEVENRMPKTIYPEYLDMLTEEETLALFAKLYFDVETETLEHEKYYSLFTMMELNSKVFFEKFIKDKETLEAIYQMQESAATSQWTYKHCEEFTAFLVKRYSLATVVELSKYYKRQEELLGASIEELHEEWFVEEKEALAELLVLVN